jgi:ABC-type branched-subunit amino acid transport system substrate-binding protein
MIRVNETMRLGHVFSIIPSVVLNRVGISIEVASLLAVKHFNERSGAVLPHLPKLLEGCDVYLTWTPLDSEAQPMPAVRKLLQQSPPDPSQATLQKPYPMAVLGAGYSIPSESLAIIGGIRNIPQCSCCATSRDLDKTGLELFSRTTPTGQGEAHAAAAYFHHLGVEQAAVLHVGELYPQFFAEDFSTEMKALGHDNILNVEYVLSDRTSASAAIQKIKDSELRYIYGILYVGDAVMFAELASEAGIMGPNHVWIWAQGANPMTSLNGKNVSEDALRALHGVGATILDTPKSTCYNEALQAFQQDEELQQYYIGKQENLAYFDTLDMSTLLPLHYSLLNYDAAISVGLASCRIKNEFFTASELYDSILTTAFDGASGHVSFNNETGTRSFNGTRYKNLLYTMTTQQISPRHCRHWCKIPT